VKKENVLHSDSGFSFSFSFCAQCAEIYAMYHTFMYTINVHHTHFINVHHTHFINVHHTHLLMYIILVY